MTDAPNRFTRTAPVVPIIRLIHYCTKDNVRQYFDICKARECQHFRPLRPLDNGSCAFRPNKEKDAEKHANGKKNGRKPITSQDDGEFIENNAP